VLDQQLSALALPGLQAAVQVAAVLSALQNLYLFAFQEGQAELYRPESPECFHPEC